MTMWLAGGGFLLFPLVVLGMWFAHHHVERRRAQDQNTDTHERTR